MTSGDTRVVTVAAILIAVWLLAELALAVLRRRRGRERLALEQEQYAAVERQQAHAAAAGEGRRPVTYLDSGMVVTLIRHNYNPAIARMLVERLAAMDVTLTAPQERVIDEVLTEFVDSFANVLTRVDPRRP